MYGTASDRKGNLNIGRIHFDFVEENTLNMNGLRGNYVIYSVYGTGKYFTWMLALTHEEDKILQISPNKKRRINGIELFRLKA